jgi:tRNA 2-thiouridine synthesizing protein E
MPAQSSPQLQDIALDKEGYLKDLNDWNEDIAGEIALRENIRLGAAHWEIIRLLRAFYQRHQMSPTTRALVNLVKRELGSEKGRSIYLMKLFRGSPARTAGKIAGLPRPDNCL